METGWLDKNEYPFRPRYFKHHGQRLHYIDEGQGETILFVHGTPSWSFDWRHLVKALKNNYRCIAIDHLGFGLSDKPTEADYSTQAHSDRLQAFIKELRLENISLVVHDFGGPIGLNYAIHYPQNIKRIVVLNSWMWSSQDDPAFKRFSKILRSPLLPFLYRWLNFSARFVMPASFGQKKLSKTLRKQYTKPFANRHQRNGTLAFAQSLLHDQDWFESLWQKRQALNHVPFHLIWGMADKFVTPLNLQKFASGFEHVSTTELPGCGHFPQEEEHEKVTEAVLVFMHQPIP